MFKSARWRGERNRIKEVFKLQFHATQVSQPGVDALTISLVPGDVGKPTLKLEKAIVLDRSCRWENPIYEPVKFVRDPKTGKINEKTYYFIVSSGSSKAGVVGEASIDFADYAEATKASSVSFPLKSLNVNSNSNSNTVLHISIRRVQEAANEREMEETVDAKIKPHDRSLKSQFSIGDADDGIKSNSTEVNTRLNGNSRESSGSDITLLSSESSSGVNTPRELALRKNNIHHDPHKPTENASTTIHEEHQGSSHWGWSEGSDPGVCTDDSGSGSQDTHSRSNQASDVEIEKLKAELASLARQADVTEMELQTLRKQIVKETKRGQELSKEVVTLKEERNGLKMECEKLKAFQECRDDRKAINKLHTEGGDVWALLEEIRQELNYEKDLNANLRTQLEKTQEANSELILAVQDLDEILELKDKEIVNISNNASELKRTTSKCESDESEDDEEQKALEALVKQHIEAKDTYILEQKIVDLYREIDIYRRDKDELETQMEQLALDYEILKQENHDMSHRLEQSELQEQLKQCDCSSSAVNVSELENQIENLENELKKQSEEFSDSLATVKELEGQIASLESKLKKQSEGFSVSLAVTKELESHITSLEEELERQSQGFEADMEALTRAKVEQEQRAIRAEEALRKTRWKNTDTAERLQGEFRRLSTQVSSTFEANEKVAMKALTEASELRMQKRQLEEMLQRANKEIQLIKDVNLLEVSNQLDLKNNQIEQLLLEIDDKSKQLESQVKHEEEVSEALSGDILVLKAEVDRLKMENNVISQQAEELENLRSRLEKMKTSVEELEMSVQRGNEERNSMTPLKDEKETELEMLKGQYNDLKDSLLMDGLEKEKLGKQVLKLKGDLKKKDDELIVLEKKLKDYNVRLLVSDGTKITQRNNKAALVPCNTKEVENMREKMKLLEEQISSKEAALETSSNQFMEKEKGLQNKIVDLESKMEELNQNNADFCDGKDELMTELASLKEKNTAMESELKEMQGRYSEISLKFAEVEGERQRLVMTVRSLKNSKRTK